MSADKLRWCNVCNKPFKGDGNCPVCNTSDVEDMVEPAEAARPDYIDWQSRPPARPVEWPWQETDS